MRLFLQLAAPALLSATAARAQITPPEKLIAPAPRNPAAPRVDAQQHENLQWLWRYARPAPDGQKPQLLEDKRFPALLADNFRAPQAMWGTGVALSDAARTFLDGAGSVSSRDNRHLIVTGCVPDPPSTDPDDQPSPCAQRGLLWADLGEPAPLLVFAALRWNEQGHTPSQRGATYTLWLFPNRDLNAHQLPGALKNSLSAWAAAPCASTVVTDAIVVDPSGIPHVVGALDAGLSPAPCTTNPGPHA